MTNKYKIINQIEKIRSKNNVIDEYVKTSFKYDPESSQNNG